MPNKALVVVLGELARSPRMQYHCTSLANANYQVTVIATGGQDKTCDELESNKAIRQSLMPEVPDFKKYLPSILAYLLRPVLQSILLIYHLFLVDIPDLIILQNPPSIPTLPLLVIYSKILGSKLIVDWHNYGFSILSLNLRPNHPLVEIYKWIEVYFGRLANAGFCVSEAMGKDLERTFKIKYPLQVLHDKPPKRFKPLSLREKHNFYARIKAQVPEFSLPSKDCFGTRPGTPSGRSETRFTICNKNVITYRPKRPAILMSSTSWTEDEDFGVLLEALKRYDRVKAEQLIADDPSLGASDTYLPELVCVITGKGPLKSLYESKIKECKFQHVEVVLPWLTAADYAKMVASCDLGVCLHSSSSGVDLPMKVVDMFGCGIPVLAYKYDAINELVIENRYGLTFTGSMDLLEKLVVLLGDFYTEERCTLDGRDCPRLGQFRKNITTQFLKSRWESEWTSKALPFLKKFSPKTEKRV